MLELLKAGLTSVVAKKSRPTPSQAYGIPQAPPLGAARDDYQSMLDRFTADHPLRCNSVRPNPATWTDTATRPYTSDFCAGDHKLVVAYPRGFAGDTSVGVRDIGSDAVVSVGAATVAVLQGAAGKVTADDIVVMASRALA